jgi:hypothetical protein
VIRAHIAATALLLIALPAGAAAQAAGGWELSLYGGVAATRSPADGAVALPPPGPPIATSNPTFSARRTPSWFFGDGAAMLNAASELFGLEARLTPLDPVFTRFARGSRVAASGGARLRRGVTPRWAVEAAVDIAASPSAISSGVRDAVEATRASFEPVFRELFATGPLADVDVDAAATTSGGVAVAMTATGALQWRFPGGGGALMPYLTAGGGLTSGLGDGASATLDGRYRFAIVDPARPADPAVPIDERDVVTVRAAHGRRWVGVAGGGFRRDGSGTWSFEADVRVLVGRSADRVSIDATAVSAAGTPAGSIETGGTPSLQFSNSPSTGRSSSLGGPALQDFGVLVRDGFELRVLLTFGIVIKL